MKKLCAFHLGPIKNQPADSVKADVLLSIQDRTAPAHTQATGGTRRQKGHRAALSKCRVAFLKSPRCTNSAYTGLSSLMGRTQEHRTTGIEKTLLHTGRRSVFSIVYYL